VLCHGLLVEVAGNEVGQQRHALALSQKPAYTATTESRGVPVYATAIAGTHQAYPRRDGQAELIWRLPSADGYPFKYVLTGPDVE